MKTRKLISLSLSLAFAASMLCYTSAANAQNDGYLSDVYNDFKELDQPLSHGLNVIAYENPMILSGKTDSEISFSAEVFNDHIGYVPSFPKVNRYQCFQ